MRRKMIKKSPVTDRLNYLVQESAKIIDKYQKYEQEFSNYKSFARNYLNQRYTRQKYQDIILINEELNVIVTEFQMFKRDYRNSFDGLMQAYINKYNVYLSAVISSVNKRLELQNSLLSENGTLLSNIRLSRDMKNSINLCLESGLEVNKIATQFQQNT